jgi:Fe-S oxidoreductase
LKNEYPQYGFSAEILHHTQFIQELIASGRLMIDRSTASSEAITYHDSCYLGRYNSEFEAPRAAIENVPGLTILEPARSGDRGLCCGAGGGRMFMEEHVGDRVNITRTNELLSTGAETIAVNCPFCATMITDGVKAAEKTDTVVVRDVAEILLDHVRSN